MSRNVRSRVLFAALAALLLGASAFAGEGKVIRKKKPIPNQYIVQFESSVTSAADAARELISAYGGKLRHVYKHDPKGMAVEATAEQAEAFSRDARVLRVEEDTEGNLLQVTPVSPPGWALDRLNQTAPPLDRYFALGCNTAPGVSIYIVDTGINGRQSAEFGSRIVDLHSVNTNFFDEAGAQGHGTPVASLAAGATYGVARNATIVNVKYCAPGMCSASTFIAALDAIIADHPWRSGPKVVNISSEFEGSDTIDDKVRAIIGANIPVIAGAGNANMTACTHSPARLGTPNTPENPSSLSTITVGGTEMAGPPGQPNDYSIDRKTFLSNYGPCVDMYAPGWNLDALNAYTLQRVSPTIAGTSYSAPLVAGAAARHLKNYATPPAASVIESAIKTLASPNRLPRVPIGCSSDPAEPCPSNLILGVYGAKCRS